MMAIDDDSEKGREDVDRLFPGLFRPLGGSLFDAGPSSLHPLSKVDVDAEYVTVTFDVPGVDRDEISVTCTDDTVSIEAEMRKSFRTGGLGRSESSVEYVRYSNRILLPVAVEPDQGTARFKNGIVVVKLPRRHRGKPVKISGGHPKPKAGK
jgi:HSP20 family protein